jgi:hypothetical protein
LGTITERKSSILGAGRRTAWVDTRHDGEKAVNGERRGERREGERERGRERERDVGDCRCASLGHDEEER